MPLPGDPDAVLAASRELTRAADGLAAAREGLVARARSITADWTGRAAPAALARIEQDARALQQAAGVAARAAAPLATYAEELRQAQLDYARGEQILLDGRTALAAVGAGAVPAADAAREAASRTLSDATLLIDQAEERALVANETAARALREASAGLGAASSPAPPAGRSSALADFGNAAASFGNAALRNPLDGLAVIGGGALATVSAVGLAGSVAIDATGVGAVVGIPAGGAAAAGVVGGVGLAGAGLIGLALHAGTDSRVTPFQTNVSVEHPDAERVEDRVSTVGTPGRSRGVRVVETDGEIREVFDELSEGGVDMTPDDYNGRIVRLPDGTTVGLREVARSAPGATIETTFPDGRRSRKVHVDG